MCIIVKLNYKSYKCMYGNRSELEEWLEKRGKTPSGFRHLRCFDASLSARKKSGETVHKQDDKVG